MMLANNHNNQNGVFQGSQIVRSLSNERGSTWGPPTTSNSLKNGGRLNAPSMGFRSTGRGQGIGVSGPKNPPGGSSNVAGIDRAGNPIFLNAELKQVLSSINNGPRKNSRINNSMTIQPTGSTTQGSGQQHDAINKSINTAYNLRTSA